MFDGFLHAQFTSAEFRTAEVGDPKAESFRRKLDMLFIASGHRSLHLALIAFAVKPDDDMRDPRSRKSVKNDDLVTAVGFGGGFGKALPVF